MSQPQLDHIVILVPHAVLKSPPASLSSLFHISPGGKHTNNKGENRLVVLRDGVYLELIAFFNDDPDLKRGHWWGELPNGVIDFALTSSGGTDDVTGPGGVRERLERLKGGLGVTYQDPRAGGRTRDDGREVKWEVTFPAGGKQSDGKEMQRGGVPFWCHDVTDRELRVPAHNATATKHPSGAIGVREVQLGVPKGRMEAFVATYGAIVGDPGAKESNGTYRFAIGTPFGKSETCALVLREFDEEKPRVVKLILASESQQGESSFREAFGGGNEICIDIVSDV